ncbi:PREDICTED: protein trichome birefringence-like 14 isoform X1 [Theobroma cacao]|uniref:Protein trichome birefringence-like 14 isoform X1 n=1 Tax=Theobroma cacao TaxID=3641 RepID=A0AB32VQC9_THECC|nr:PREDICTED: protein trichome birefringence-like 14 isoform X1 [Theobroma cacao]XP_007048437.2 PREDICTED: protein trichome birefringence-like 14 isoform X1 [Theobroma cacao]
MEKKGGDSFRFPGKLLFLAVLALVFMTLLLRDRDRNPFISSHESAQNQYTTPPPAPACFLHDPSNSSVSMEPEMKTNEGNSQSMTIEEREEASENVDSSATSYPPEKEDGNKNGTSLVETKVCNYAKGRWVADSRPPLYTVGCKYMQRNWACRLTNRTDFSYEDYRWQPIDCKMPEFEPSDFLRRMQDKTVAFIGDSLSREQFQSMMCMLTRGEGSPDVEDVADKYGFLKLIRKGAYHHHGWAYRFRSTNTTILHTWSARLCDRKPINATDPNTLYAMHLDGQPAFIRENLNQINVLVINTAHHWSKTMVNMDKEVMYVNGTPVHDKFLRNIENAKIFKVNNIVKWLDSELASHPNLQVFFRTTSPRHFFKGEWNTGGKCDNLVPMTRGSEVLGDESSDKIVAAAVQGTRVKILDITALSDLRDEAHISHYGHKANDCLHWCLPGVPDTWNELLSAQV